MGAGPLCKAAVQGGPTDSEVLFLTMARQGPEQDASRAVAWTIVEVAALPDRSAPNQLTCLLSDGDRIVAVRHSGDGPAPTLYLSKGPLTHGGRALTSEPLDGVAANWLALDEDALVTMTPGAVVVDRLDRVKILGKEFYPRRAARQDQTTSPRKM